jgi:hypothetical protein
MSTQISSDRDKTFGVAPEFIREVEDELSGRLGQPVALVLVPENDTIAVKAESELFAGESIFVMDASPLLSRKRVADWADAFERKINRLARRADDAERLYAAIQKSPSPEKTGEIVLEHIGDYDDDFFEALGMVIAHEKGWLRLGRARDFEALREYLRVVRRRARDGETAAMWRELAQGAARERDLGS